MIKNPLEYSLGSSNIKSFPKLQYNKIVEIIKSINGTIKNVTQVTSITTGVIANGTRGVITTVSLTTAASTVAGPFIVTDNNVKTTSVVDVSVEYANGKTGFPIALIEAVASGTFNVRILNAHISQALNDVVKIHYTIINP